MAADRLGETVGQDDRAVSTVAYHRMPCHTGMAPDLMNPPRLRTAFDERAAPGVAPYPIAGDSGPARRGTGRSTPTGGPV
jgi:hypothetical protein